LGHSFPEPDRAVNDKDAVKKDDEHICYQKVDERTGPYTPFAVKQIYPDMGIMKFGVGS
jgi:hypothetical protein